MSLAQVDRNSVSKYRSYNRNYLFLSPNINQILIQNTQAAIEFVNNVESPDIVYDDFTKIFTNQGEPGIYSINYTVSITTADPISFYTFIRIDDEFNLLEKFTASETSDLGIISHSGSVSLHLRNGSAFAILATVQGIPVNYTVRNLTDSPISGTKLSIVRVG